MLDTLTFIRPSGAHKLCKKFTPDHAEPYPMVSAVSSRTAEAKHTGDGLDARLRLYRTASEHGEALLKGQLSKELRNESRAGHTKKDLFTNSIIIDIDGISVPEPLDYPCTAETVTGVCEYAISMLPGDFHNVSYIGHASSSFGIKADKASVHIEFMLTKPISPRALKNILFGLNFLNEDLCDQLTLTATGTALRYVIDPSLADNSRLVYIAAPLFDGIANPFKMDRHRFTLVRKMKDEVDPTPLLTLCSPEFVQSQQRKKIRALRKEAGLPSKSEKTVALGFNGNQVRIASNPDNALMEYSWHNDMFVYYNIHRAGHQGDSSAYYVRLDNPEVVFNFKNEPFFRFKDVDPEAYEEHLTRFVHQVDYSSARFQPLVFRDFQTDLMYNALIDREKDAIHEYAVCARRQSLEEFMQQHGEVMPDRLDTYDFSFRPDLALTMDMDATPRPFLNRFAKSEHMRSLDKAPKTIPYDAILDNITGCQSIVRILMSAMGDDQDCVRHFIHWLAYIFQHRKRANTSWIFQGTFGTGKGLIGTEIIPPLFGPRYVTHIRNDELDEKFNAWAQESLIVVVDEFEIGDAKHEKALMSRLKGLITEDNLAVRAMRSDTRNVQNYCNFIFNSNGYEVITLFEKDRRWNVAPRQEVPLQEKWPNVRTEVSKAIELELDAFAELLGSIRTDKNLAESVVENEARAQLIELSETTIDQFCCALKFGDMDYFSEILGRPNSLRNEYLPAAKITIKRMLRDAGHGEEFRATMDDITALYNAALETSQTSAKVGKTLSKRGITTKKFKINRRIVRGLAMRICYDEVKREELIEEFFTLDELLAMDDPAVSDLIARKKVTEQTVKALYKH